MRELGVNQININVLLVRETEILEVGRARVVTAAKIRCVLVLRVVSDQLDDAEYEEIKPYVYYMDVPMTIRISDGK